MRVDPIASLLEVCTNPRYRSMGFVVSLFWLAAIAPPATLLAASDSSGSVIFALLLLFVTTCLMGWKIANLQLEVLSVQTEQEPVRLSGKVYFQLLQGAVAVTIVASVLLFVLGLGSAMFFAFYDGLVGNYSSDPATGRFSSRRKLMSVIVVGLGSLVAYSSVVGFLGSSLRGIHAGVDDWMKRAMTYGFGRIVQPTSPEMVWITYVYAGTALLSLTALALSSGSVFGAPLGGFLGFCFAVANTLALPVYYGKIPLLELGIEQIEEDEVDNDESA